MPDFRHQRPLHFPSGIWCLEFSSINCISGLFPPRNGTKTLGDAMGTPGMPQFTQHQNTDARSEERIVDE